MCNYCKPFVLMNEELAEGVYAASGAPAAKFGGPDCWTVNAYIHQWPETGRDSYVIQTTGTHLNPDHHLSNIQITYHFNQTVTFESCNGGTLVGNGTSSSITLERNIGTPNSNEGLGLGDLYVVSESGLSLLGISWVCTGK